MNCSNDSLWTWAKHGRCVIDRVNYAVITYGHMIKRVVKTVVIMKIRPLNSKCNT
jgi:hypothetical protein